MNAMVGRAGVIYSVARSPCVDHAQQIRDIDMPVYISVLVTTAARPPCADDRKQVYHIDDAAAVNIPGTRFTATGVGAFTVGSEESATCELAGVLWNDGARAAIKTAGSTFRLHVDHDGQSSTLRTGIQDIHASAAEYIEINAQFALADSGFDLCSRDVQ